MKKAIYIVIGLLVLAGVVFIIVSPGRQASGQLDSFATCIKNSGATFYGAFWCPHCQAQKARFGSSAHLLPYVECSMPDGQTQTQVCINKNITTYPTWEFPVVGTTTDATGATVSTTTIVRVVGEQELTDLARETGCALPDSTGTTALSTTTGTATTGGSTVVPQ